jgi:hypothetical protein
MGLCVYSISRSVCHLSVHVAGCVSNCLFIYLSIALRLLMSHMEEQEFYDLTPFSVGFISTYAKFVYPQSFSYAWHGVCVITIWRPMNCFSKYCLGICLAKFRKSKEN